MGTITQDSPKCIAVVLGGKTLLQIQLETLRASGISEISLVRGYCADKINYPGLRYYHNDSFANNNVLESLFHAEEELDTDLVVAYSDIWYGREIIERLCRCQHDIALAVDTNWKEEYVGRKEHPVTEAENVVFDSNKRVIKIGKGVVEDGEDCAEFIGIMKLTARGGKILRMHYHRAKEIFNGQRFQRAKTFQESYLTDLLQEMVGQGVPIHCENVDSDWREIDTAEDYQKVVTILRERSNIKGNQTDPGI